MSDFEGDLKTMAAPFVTNPKPELDWWKSLGRVFRSLESLRDGRALFVLLAAFTGAGLGLACARASLGRQELVWAIGQGAGALFVAFYGAQAAGLMLMDRANQLQPRDGWQALSDALGIGHRTLVVVGCMSLLGSALGAALLGLYWLCGLPTVGPWLFVVVVPVTVVVIGWMFLVGAAVVAPLTAPLVWAGSSSWQTLKTLYVLMKRQLLPAAVLAGALSLLTGLVGGVISLLVMLGGRVMAEASILIMGFDIPPQALMVGLFGKAVQISDHVSWAPEALQYVASATIGGGLVFGVALVAPSLVYLRGVCEIALVLSQPQTPAIDAAESSEV